MSTVAASSKSGHWDGPNAVEGHTPDSQSCHNRATAVPHYRTRLSCIQSSANRSAAFHAVARHVLVQLLCVPHGSFFIPRQNLVYACVSFVPLGMLL